ncbi:MAG TPA: insulinase family protein [Salinivirgaceae bacterium]|nr:insulinase family protein [Salinivirgaceae bacterium]
MKKLNLLALLTFVSYLIGFGQNNDCLKVETYKLSNGMTVMLNVDHNVPTVQGMVVVKGGSKRDPKDATGIAHYFEHIMFKGTDSIGTIDWKSEKIFLDSITSLYDRLGNTKDPQQRLNIQKEINRISIQAAQYAIPNEVDKILGDMGGTGINAGTGYESIVYHNTFPSNQIEKWLEVYYERFRNPVFRLFQSELETVYEEKNMYEDSPFSKLLEELLKNYFPNSVYGQQTVIGTTEHLKNPSLSKMMEYYRTYYVGNNMALILTGDFDPKKIKPIIEKTFSQLPAGNPIAPLTVNEEPFKGRVLVSKRLTPVKIGVLGFRSIPKNHPDKIAIEICANILSNGESTGLLDQLSNEGKLLFAQAMDMSFEEIGGAFIIFAPKIIGQSLPNAEKLVKEQLEKLKAGQFSEQFLQAVKTEMKVSFERSLEDFRWRAYSMSDIFVYGNSWDDLLQYPEKVDRITKEQIVEVANRYFTDNYLAFHSKMGSPKKDKIQKPSFKPIEVKNTDQKSEYAKRIESIPTTESEPRFIEFDKDVMISITENGSKFFYTQNPVNNIFTLTFVFGKGSFDDPLAEIAGTLFEKCSPTGISYATFKEKLQFWGGSISSSTSLNRTKITISGLEQNFAPIMNLFDSLVQNIDLDPVHIRQLAEAKQMEHKSQIKDVSSIGDALIEYVKYGDKSEYLTSMTAKQISALSKEQILSKIKEIMTYEFDIHFIGKTNRDVIVEAIAPHLSFTEKPLPKLPIKEKTIKSYPENTIFVCNYPKAVQSQINFYVVGGTMPKADRYRLDGFNEYLDGGMASIIFQEIREFRSLAYGASGRYIPSLFDTLPGHFSGWLSTQSDKTLDAVDTYVSILQEMPQKTERITSIQKSLTLSINANQPNFRSKSSTVANWLDQGYPNDPRKKKYEHYQNLSFDEIVDFYAQQVKNRPIIIAIAGNTKGFSTKDLQKYGKVNTIDMKTIFKQ